MTIMGVLPEARPARNRRRVAVTVLIWLLILPGLLWALVRLGGLDRGPLVQLLAFTPYVAAWSLVPAALALGTRRWPAAGLAIVVVAAFAVFVLPRAVPGGRGPADGVRLRVMTSNLLIGGADPDTIVRLVRDQGVDVLAVQEFTPDAKDALAKAGLGDLLPYASLAAEPGALGSGLYSRFPVREAGHQRNRGGFEQAYGTIQPPGAGALLVESAHPLAPWALRVNPDWRQDLEAEPPADPGGPPRILLGDFNATLDHAPLRRLIATGYRDAGAATGQGLVPTWPYEGHPGIPKITIDHVLVDRRIGVRELSVRNIPRSDHRAVIAELAVPKA
ncbi:endonuclease/exonuclease/phosphatase family protein [Actinoplanes sp. KI2]|uniref:endonuclease/exonuclease/phosphatase family protein n=1 Tax=Actinoplanes sp. KI2 TaxID=2983315 RepID=UPI0021D5B9B7|nr:endonuclease/exonuclease/phosphatase family protein [Actinoplanes sp. KI2]MCU7723617.1 endonuclease/exonuclease/phosphatase family protein [Actinoplanes sp. KI2]